jgi:predicted kinase
LRKASFAVAPEERLPERAYAESVSEEIYARLNGSAGQALAAGQSVILDAVFARAAEREAAKALAARVGVSFRAFWLEADRGMMHARIEARRGDVSDATPAVLERQLGYDLGPLDWTRIDASGPAETVAARLSDAIDEG